MQLLERRTVLKAGLLAPAAAAVTLACAESAEAKPVIGRTLAGGLAYPWGMAFLPNGSALVGQRDSGKIIRVRPGGGYTTVGTVPGVYNDGGEGGLLGLAVSPAYRHDHLIYAFFTTHTDNRIVRMTYANGKLGAPHVLVSGIPRGPRHNGGGLWFTRHHNLIATTGDTGAGGGYSQDKSSLAGKVLRMRKDGSPHPANPFGNRVLSFGHRNPEGVTEDAHGRLWISELGEDTWDEMNHVLPGRNYGWPRQEGADGPGGYTDPFVQWHPSDCSPSGIACVHGRAWIGALRGESLWSVDLYAPGARRKVRHFQGQLGRIRNVKKAPDGSLWITTSNGSDDKVVRIAFR